MEKKTSARKHASRRNRATGFYLVKMSFVDPKRSYRCLLRFKKRRWSRSHSYYRKHISRPGVSWRIRDIGSFPFHVFYSTRAQLHAYEEYCRANKQTSSIKVDATGNRTLDRKYQGRSTHIFLYSIVINFEKTTIRVKQMLSEQHNAPFVEFRNYYEELLDRIKQYAIILERYSPFLNFDQF